MSEVAPSEVWSLSSLHKINEGNKSGNPDRAINMDHLHKTSQTHQAVKCRKKAFDCLFSLPTWKKDKQQMSGRSQTTGGEAHRSRWACPWIPPCSLGSWGRNTRGCCARPGASSSILAAHNRSGGGVKGQSGHTESLSQLLCKTFRKSCDCQLCGRYLGGSGVWVAVHSLCRGDVRTLGDKIWKFQRQETCWVVKNIQTYHNNKKNINGNWWKLTINQTSHNNQSAMKSEKENKWWINKHLVFSFSSNEN